MYVVFSVVAVVIRPVQYTKEDMCYLCSHRFFRPPSLSLTSTKASVNENSAVLRTYMHHIQWAVGQKI